MIDLTYARALSSSCGAHAYQGDGKPFEYSRLAPGDYILLFGSHANQDWIDPDHPFPQTFYPSAPSSDRPESAADFLLHLPPLSRRVKG